MQQIPEWLKDHFNKRSNEVKKHNSLKPCWVGYERGFKECFELLSKPENAAKIECVKNLIESSIVAETYHQRHNSIAGNSLRRSLKPFQGDANEN